jgi:hypothetical protein
MDAQAAAKDDSADSPIVEAEIHNISLNNSQVLKGGDFPLHALAIEAAIGLGPGTTDGRALLSIEETKLDTRSIRNTAHKAVKCINLTNEMAFPQSADGRIAGHDPNRISLMGDEAHCCTKAGSDGRCFASGMATADDDNIKFHGHFDPDSMFHVKRATRLANVAFISRCRIPRR